MWSLAVEVAFYVVLPLLAYLLLVVLCRRRWQPMLLLTGLAALALITPAWLILVHTTDFLPDGARLWLPTYLAWFIGGMMLAVLQSMGVRAYALVCVPLAVVCYFIVSTPIAGAPTTSPANLREALFKAVFYAVIATLAVAPLALRRSGRVREVPGQPADGLPWRDLVRDLPDPPGDDGTRDGRDPALSHLHRLDARPVRGHVRGDGAGGLAAAPVHPRPLGLGPQPDKVRLSCPK